MKLFLSSLANIFRGEKKRHNSEVDPTLAKGPLTREEFMRIYESMPERARAQLFSSLEYAQKARLLQLLTPDAETKTNAEPQADPPQWLAEDYLPEKDERKIERLRHVREVREVRALFGGFAQYAPELVAEAMAAESTALIAVVLLQLEKRFASKVLKAMPELRRGEIVRAMAAERKISGEALVAVGKKIAARLAEMPDPELAKTDGIKHINDILKLLGADEAARITRAVEEEDSELAARLETTRYTFEDLAHLNARDFRMLFSSIPDEKLWARALKATDQLQRKQLLGKLPLKRAGMIAGAMAEIRTTRLDSIDKARGEIVRAALALAAKHKISFPGHQPGGMGLH